MAALSLVHPETLKVAWLTRTKPRVRALGGAISSATTDPERIAEQRVKDWQMRAWRYWRPLGELHHPTTRIARSLTQVEWQVEVNGTPLEDRAREEAVAEATRGIGEDEATRRVALNLQVAGDGWYVEEEDGSFEVYSVTAKKLKEKVERAQAGQRIALRVYNPDPEDIDSADAAMRSALGPAEDLMLLEALSRSESRSRMAQAGVWALPTGVEGNEEFFQDLEAAQGAAIRDEHAPDAVTPLFFEYPAELIPALKEGLITFERAFDDRIAQRIETATKRIALALDIPVELLLGLGDINHWTAWLVDEDNWKSHQAPLADQVGELYARVYEMKRNLPEGTARFIPDPARLLARKSTIRDAFDGAKLGAVGLAYVREVMNANDEDAPTLEDIATISTLQGRTVERTPGVDENPGPPAIAASLSNSLITGAALMARDQARARVGAKLRSKIARSPAAKTIDGVDNCDVVAVLGLDVARRHLDLDREIVEALSGFSQWWTKHDPAPLPAATATLLLATHLADTLAIPYDDAGSIPTKLVSDLASGLRAVGAAATPVVDLDKLARELSDIDRKILQDGGRLVSSAGERAVARIYADALERGVPEHPRAGFTVLRDAGVDVYGIIDSETSQLVEWWEGAVRESYEKIGDRIPLDVDVETLVLQSTSILLFGAGLWIASNLDREPSDQLQPPTSVIRKAMAKAGGG